MINDTLVRSRTTIIKGLLRRAFNGESGYTLQQMKTMIAARLERARDVPEGHRMILAVIRAVEKDSRDFRQALRDAGVTEEEIGPDSRALKVLSIRERLNGRNVSYHNAVEALKCEEVRPDLNPARITLMPKVW